MKRCYACKITKPLSEFSINRTKRDGLSDSCKPCRKIAKQQYYKTQNGKDHARQSRARYAKTEKGKRSRRHHVLFQKHGIGIDDYERMLKEQDGRCAICRQVESTKHKYLCVDHNHQTGKIRGLLCSNCNFGIGNLKESPEIMQAAIDYILKHKSTL